MLYKQVENPNTEGLLAKIGELNLADFDAYLYKSLPEQATAFYVFA